MPTREQFPGQNGCGKVIIEPFVYLEIDGPQSFGAGRNWRFFIVEFDVFVEDFLEVRLQPILQGFVKYESWAAAHRALVATDQRQLQSSSNAGLEHVGAPLQVQFDVLELHDGRTLVTSCHCHWAPNSPL